MFAAVEATTARLDGIGARNLGRVADALVTTELDDFYGEFDTAFDHLDVLVNVVGGVRQRRFESSSRGQWHDDIHRNFGYALDSIAAALPHVRAGGNGGSIVNFTTIEAHRGAAGFAVYAGAKAALTNFSRALAVELAPDRIRVNMVAPDTTPSEGNTDRGSGKHDRSDVGRRTEPDHGNVRYLRADATPTHVRRPRRRGALPRFRPVSLRHGDDGARRWRHVGGVGLPTLARAVRMAPLGPRNTAQRPSVRMTGGAMFPGLPAQIEAAIVAPRRSRNGCRRRAQGSRSTHRC